VLRILTTDHYHRAAASSQMKVLLCLFYGAQAIRIQFPVNTQSPTLEQPALQIQQSWLDYFGDEKYDMEAGEAIFFANQLQSAGIDKQFLRDMFVGINYNMTGRMKALWAIAAKEENFTDYSLLSDFGRAIPKYPRSWVAAIQKLDHTKKIRYMFSGSLGIIKKLKFRKWLPQWVKAHFGPEDYFKATDVSSKWKTLGEFDQSLSETKGFRPKSDCPGGVHDACMMFDGTYWERMAQSKFIIAPGGDAPYSFRFYESFLAGSIPVIHNKETDWKERQCTSWVNMVGYKHAMADEVHEYDQQVADLNLKKFIRYQTWVEGDHNPKDDEKNGYNFPN